MTMTGWYAWALWAIVEIVLMTRLHTHPLERPWAVIWLGGFLGLGLLSEDLCWWDNHDETDCKQ